MSDCKEFQLLASLVIDGEASEAEQAELTAHMEVCPACRAYFEDIRRIHESFAREEAHLPEDFARHVMDRVRETAQDRPQEKPHMISFRHWRQWAALAACCAIVALGVWRFQSQEGHLEAGQMARSAAMPAAVEDAAALAETEAENAAPAMEEAEDTALAADPPTSGGTADTGVSRSTDGEARKAADSETAYTSNAAPSPETAAGVPTDSALPEEQPSPSYSDAIEAGAPLAEEAGLLTAEEAQAMALAHAGLTGDEAAFTKWELEWEDGRQVYDIEFCAAGTEYGCEIDAATGAVVKFDCDMELSHAHTTPDASAGAVLTQEQALEIALGEVPGATVDDVTKLELDRDDGIQLYEVKILYNGMKYELEISAADGTILEFECEEDSGHHGRH